MTVPDEAVRYGFVNEPVGTHGSRTMMLAELRALLAACPPSAGPDAYRSAVLDDNVLLKATATTRRETIRRLRELYGLSPDVALFRSLRALWDADEGAQPLIALLCAVARDPILRASADLVLGAPVGSVVSAGMTADAAAAAFPDRWGPGMLKNIGRHLPSTWEQAGLLEGRANKTRTKAHASPAAAAYALFLGHLCGARGLALFETLWARLLDTSPAALDGLAFAASQRGWLEYRRMGDVVQITFPMLLAGAGVAHGDR